MEIKKIGIIRNERTGQLLKEKRWRKKEQKQAGGQQQRKRNREREGADWEVYLGTRLVILEADTGITGPEPILIGIGQLVLSKATFNVPRQTFPDNATGKVFLSLLDPSAVVLVHADES